MPSPPPTKPPSIGWSNRKIALLCAGAAVVVLIAAPLFGGHLVTF